MIRADAGLTIQRIPLARLIVTEYQPRYLDRVSHYVGLMQQPEHRDSAPGLLCVKPRPDGYYELLDGHHRFCAHILTGRAEALCVVIDETASAGSVGY